MDNIMNLVIPLIILGVVLLMGAVAFIVISNASKKDKEKKESNNLDKNINNKSNDSKSSNSDGVKRSKDNLKREDIFKFMEFDKIQDNMIVQSNGAKYTMAIKCKGINYDLMSEVEQLAVEEGFITFLNTLRYPVQLYVQAQNIDLKKSVNIYKERLDELRNRFEEENTKFNSIVNSLDSDEDEIKRAQADKSSIQNVYEYASDIVKYVEKLSVNKSLLQRNFYVLVSYYSAEITSASNFSKDEIANICYNELYTRLQAIISALSACSVSGEVLDSNELAELLYSSYNRDDKNIINVHQSLESGFYRLYSTSKDAFEKRNEMLQKSISEEARLRAIDALKKAIDDGTYQTKEDKEDEYDEDVAREAIDLVDGQKTDPNIKNNAKRIIADQYKQERREKLEQRKKDVEEAQKEVLNNNTSNVNYKDSNSNDNNSSNGVKIEDNIQNNISETNVNNVNINNAEEVKKTDVENQNTNQSNQDDQSNTSSNQSSGKNNEDDLIV